LIKTFKGDRISLGEFVTILTLRNAVKNKTTEKKMKNQISRTTLYLTRGAIIAAMYVILTYVSMAFGLDKGVIQFRISEALCILPFFLPEAVLGLYVGCILSNILTGCMLWDVIFGSLATLIGACGARLLHKLPKKLLWLVPLPNVIANTAIVPFILRYVYGSPDSLSFMMLTVGVGEVVCSLVLGTVLIYSLKKVRFFNGQ
jgi:uncharacterized membrane protein